MRRYRQKFLGHDLLVWQRADGKWKAEIRGSRGISIEHEYWTEIQAKWTVHLLAHWYLQNGAACTCSEPPPWVREDDDRQDAPPADPERPT